MTARPPPRLTTMTAPLLVWALHFLGVYSVQGLACARGLWRSRVGGLETATWVLLAMTLLALVAIAWLGLRSLAAWRGADPDAHPGARRRRFLALLGGLVAVLAAIATVLTAVPVPLLPPCR